MSKDIDYAKAVVSKKINAPKYVKKQCRLYLRITDGRKNSL